MKVFISWSGERSKAVANMLRIWLPDVIQDVVPWMSASDIDAGARWSRNIQDQLTESKFGIVCVTAENQASPWILFEAGALAKTIDDTYVCPYLIGIEPSELAVGPLTQFQAKTATEEGTRDLIRTLNRASKDAALPDDKVDRAFTRWWPDVQSSLSNLPVARTSRPKRSRDDMIEEILVGTREIKRLLQSTDLRDPGEWLLPLLAGAATSAPGGEKRRSRLVSLLSHDDAAMRTSRAPYLNAILKALSTQDPVKEEGRPDDAPKDPGKPSDAQE